VAILWRDIQMVERVTFDGQKQRDALTGFQAASGIDATTAARAVHLSYPQYNRYLWGKLPLRTDQIPLFAAAYGISKAELTRALGLMDDEIDPVLRERVIAALGPEAERRTPEYIDEVTLRLSQQDEDVREDALRELYEDKHAVAPSSC
jgi:hypothetical protein